MTETVPRRGLDDQGYIAREGALGLVASDFRPVVAAARDRLLDVFGARLDSAYLYGSIPRGTARVGRSDLDLLVALRAEPTEADRADARALDEALDKEFAQIDGAGTLLSSRARLLSDLETYDGGWFVACLCTPLLGDDLAEYLPRYRPDTLLARETNGDLGLLLPRWRARIAGADDSDDARRPLVRFMSRRLVRTGFTLVMPRWGGWTSDLGEMAEAFGSYYPARAEQLRTAAVLGDAPTGDAGALRSYVEDLGPWLAEEYARVHGVKAPRPD
ncbi:MULTISPECIES: nucleotidyltransferase domain-containing protein [Streptomyces]|uniref:nucleotidyltransferase domain-containing protein n=1 Tax=Streptomyces TaxID=1883 RepID=UPI0004C49AAE|nr:MULTISPECIES: nucleotidyltransferase domain-containing protein [unclassified Streptomyces]SEC76905.1 Nucleotidyltransferase domain-containing protein [Streptomyces sp. KS_5]SEC93632.1 Nucleotidyltransferase domain-containing protein [Streptomyces sp. PAN_FS17]